LGAAAGVAFSDVWVHNGTSVDAGPYGTVLAPPSHFDLITSPFDAVLPGDQVYVYGATLSVALEAAKAGDAWLVPSHMEPVGVVSAPLSGAGTVMAMLRGRATIPTYNRLLRATCLAVVARQLDRNVAGSIRVGYVYWNRPWIAALSLYVHATDNSRTHSYMAVPVRGAIDAAALARGATGVLTACDGVGLYSAAITDFTEAIAAASTLRLGDLRYAKALERLSIGTRLRAASTTDWEYTWSGDLVVPPVGDSFWLAREPAAVATAAMVILGPRGVRWRSVDASSTVRQASLCDDGPNPSYRAVVSKAYSNPPAGLSSSDIGAVVRDTHRLSHGYVNPSTGRLALFPFSNRTADGFGGTAATDPLSDVQSSAATVYGLSVQLTGPECRGRVGNDSLSVVGPAPLINITYVRADGSVTNLTIDSPLIAAAQRSMRYFRTACLLLIPFADPVPARDVVPLLERVRFTTRSLSRSSLRFAYVLWQNPRAVDAFVDPLNSAVIVRVATPSALRVQRIVADGLCSSLGPQWSLVRAPTATLQYAALYAHTSTDAALTSAVYLQASQATGVTQFAYDDGSDLMDVSWAAGHPVSAACVTLNDNAGVHEWRAVACTTAVANVRCEAPAAAMTLTGAIIWTLRAPSSTAAPAPPLPIITAALAGTPPLLAAADADRTPIYGVRALVAYFACRDADLWDWLVADDRLQLSERSPCAVEVIGRAHSATTRRWFRSFATTGDRHRPQRGRRSP
jgi:hypothetical protein